MTYKILAIDGGGIKGIVPAMYLAKSDNYVANLYAGTSTGSIIASALACGFCPENIVDMYSQLAKKVFSNGIFDTLREGLFLVKAKHTLNNFKTELTNIFGNRKLGDANNALLITSLNLNDKGIFKPKIMQNMRKNDPDLELSLVDCILRSCAAPTYFPSYQGFVDGGLVANNPSLCAVTEAIYNGVKLDNIELLSLGCYQQRSENDGLPQGDIGLVQWAVNIVDVMLASNVDVTTFQCKQLLGERFKRVSFVGTHKAALDSVSDMNNLKNNFNNLSVLEK